MKKLVQIFVPRDPVEVVQESLGGEVDAVLDTLTEAMGEIVRTESWRWRKSAAGPPFTSFGKFANARLPHGLGIRDQESFHWTRYSLRDLQCYAALTEILEVSVRQPGRTPKTLTDDEGFRFLTISTSYHSIERILLTLKRKFPALFQDVCELRLSPHQAAIKAGFVRPMGADRCSVSACVAHCADLYPRAQAEFLSQVFSAVTLDAQCALLANVVEPVLGESLARRWREFSNVGRLGSTAP